MNPVLAIARDETGKWAVLFVGQNGVDGDRAVAASQDVDLLRSKGLRGKVKVQVVRGTFIDVFRSAQVDLGADDGRGRKR